MQGYAGHTHTTTNNGLLLGTINKCVVVMCRERAPKNNEKKFPFSSDEFEQHACGTSSRNVNLNTRLFDGMKQEGCLPVPLLA